jgi:hypothetical protein
MLYAGQYDLKPTRQPPQRRLGAARSMKSPRGWKRRFDDPIPLPRGRQLVTLEDAGNYITKLPKSEHEMAEWQAAMEALILSGDVWRAHHVRAHRHILSKDVGERRPKKGKRK